MNNVALINLPAHLNDESVKEWAASVAGAYHAVIKELRIIFVDDDEILRINKKYLQHDYFTDIITFDYTEREGLLRGEVYISLETVLSNSKMLTTDYKDELCRVIAHGLLHLVGFKDKTPEEQSIMRKEEEKCLLLRPKNLVIKVSRETE